MTVIQTVLMRLKAKAQEARGQLPIHKTVSHRSGTAALLPETGVDELAVFGGQTKILVSKILSQQSRRSNPQGSPSPASAASSPSANSEDSYGYSDPVPEVHPSLVEYLSMLPPPAVSSSPASPLPTRFNFDQNLAFQPDKFANVQPAMTSGSPSQQTFVPTPLPSVFDEQLMRNFADANFFGSPPSADAVTSSFGNIEHLISGESRIDETWLALMQDVLNPPFS